MLPWRFSLETGGGSLPTGIRRNNASSAESIDASSLVTRYCLLLHERHGTYEAVAAISGLDRKTVKKDIEAARNGQDSLRATFPCNA